MDTKMKIKQEPYLLETVSTNGICELNMACGSDVQIKNESTSLTSEIIHLSKGDTERQHNEIDVKIENKGKSIHPERTSNEVNFVPEVIALDIQIKNEPPSSSSENTFHSKGDAQRQNNKTGIKIENEEEPLQLEKASNRVKFASEVTPGDVQIKSESTSFSEIVFQSKGDAQMQNNKTDIKIENEEEPIQLEKTSSRFAPEVTPGNVQIKNEPTSLSSEIIFQSKGDAQRQDNDADIKAEIREKPVYLKTTSRVKFVSEVTSGSDVQVKNESTYSSPDIVFLSDSEVHRADNEINTKVKLKEEPEYLEITFSELKSETKDADLHFSTEDKATEEYQGLSNSSRFSTEATQNPESNFISTGLCDDFLKLRENTSSCQVKTDENVTEGSNIAKAHHRDNSVLNKCNFCGKCFILATNLQTHIANHELKGKHNHNIYEKNFNQASQLKAHNLQSHVNHKDKRKYKCNICEKSFIWASQLKTHNLQSHVTFEDKRKHKCDICEESFIWASQLKAHNLKSHKTLEDKRKHKCNICEQSFIWASQLKAHNLKSHKTLEDKRKHKCNICEQSFIWASQLKAHNVKSHATLEDKRKHKCNICEKSFIWASQLKAHNLQSHVAYEEKEKHRCEICKQNFTSASKLKAHNIQYHINLEDNRERE